MSGLYEQVLEDPAKMVDGCYDDGYRLSREQIETVQLEGARKRFRELRPKLNPFPGINVFLVNPPTIRIGGRGSRSL